MRSGRVFLIPLEAWFLAALLLLPTFAAFAPKGESRPSPHPTGWSGSAGTSTVRYVNPFIGTSAGGNTFPGAAFPHGMVQWSPDNVAGTGGTSYDYGNNFITHFSLTNFSGRGCSSEQDISFMPTVGKLQTSPADEASYQSNFSHQSE